MKNKNFSTGVKKSAKILILGSGFGGIYALKHLHRSTCGRSDVELALVGERNHFLFTPLLHEVATGGLNPASTVEPIRKFLGCCRSIFRLGKAGFISTKDRTVLVDGIPLPYDYLVIATGAETNFYGIPGADMHTFPLKSVEDALRIKNHILRVMERAAAVPDRAERKKLLTFVVAGGGPTGVELAAEIEELVAETFSHYYPEEVIADVSVILIQKASELVPQLSARIREKSLEILHKKGIKVMLSASIEKVEKDFVLLGNGKKIETRTVIWSAGIKPAAPRFDAPVERAPDGRLVVNQYFELKGQNNIFAIGDVAAVSQNGAYLPALAQVAEKEAKALAKNLLLMLEGKEPEKFTYKHSGTLLSLGQWNAAAEIGGFTFYGRFAWWVWRTIYLFKFISWRKKIRVAIDWTINLFSPRDISEL